MTTHTVQIKTLVMGDIAVGKTVAIDFYTKKTFEPKYNPTHQPRMVSTQLSIADEIVAIHFWEMSTNMPIQSSNLWEQVDGVILAVDLSNLDSFISIEKCLQRFYEGEKNNIGKNTPFMVCCLKNDLHPLEVDTAVVKQWCKARGHNFDFHLCSSKYGIGVDDAFHTLILEANRAVATKERR